MSDTSLEKSAYDGPDRRIGPRRRVTRRIDLECRLGTLGLSPDLAIGIVDVSEDGMGVRLKAAVVPGADVDLSLSFPILGKTLKLRGEVCWCTPGPHDTFVAGVRLRRRLTHLELADLT